MIVANGFIAFATVADEFGIPMPCNIEQKSQTLQDSVNGETYTRTSYTVLIDRCEGVTECVQLYQVDGRLLGTFDVKSIEVLSFVNITRLCL